MSVAHVMGSGGISFVAKEKVHTVTRDNPNFDELVKLIKGGCTDENLLVSLTSTKELILSIGGDRLKVAEHKLFLDGEKLSAAWYVALLNDSSMARILLINVGDEVTIAGDEDAPDGVYTVQGVDNDDPAQRVYLETEEGFLGFIQSTSIKEIRHAPA